MEVRFALASSPVFSRTDTVTDSERFYTSILDLFGDVEEIEEVNDLQAWWNRYVFTPISFHYDQLKHGRISQIFPNYSSARRPICKNSALARIKEKRAELKASQNV
jgi:hypothetical protein